MTFPFALREKSLEPQDLARMAGVFARTVTEYLPCDTVDIVPVFQEKDAPRPVQAHWLEAVRQVSARKQPLMDPGQGESGRSLYLPLWNGTGIIGVAVISGGEPGLYEASVSWLLERSHIISREFLLLKQYFLDPMTGLLNGRHFHEELVALLGAMAQPSADQGGALAGEGSGAIITLLELFPRAGDAERGVSYIQRAASYLDSLIGHSALLHHFGAGIFGQIWSGIDVDQARKMGDVLLRRLKRENFRRAHMGIAPVHPAEPAGGEDAGAILEHAWQALRTARKRGPFGLCAHVTAEELAAHPLKPLDRSLRMKLSRLWRGRDNFAVVLLQHDRASVGPSFSKRLISLAGPGVVTVGITNREAFFYLDGVSMEDALAWAEALGEKIKLTAGGTVSMGVAGYPDHDFKKSDIPVNARKALIHTRFLGPGTVTAFNGVSLNISGDIYYNEGNLPRALKEYRLGLAMDPANVNLLNSLGVTYAQMNRHRVAIPFFEKALAVDAKNYMALFNLGFAYLRSRRPAEAISSFEQAVAVDDQHVDLLLQLGKMYCRTGRYREAIDLLRRCESAGSDEERRNADYGAVHRYLGQALMAEGDHKQAMVSLERAVRLNPRDAASLSMLGELYGAEGQGDAIALSLCRQAVELDDSQWEHWFRLAAAQQRVGERREAVAALQKSLRLDRKNVPAAFLLASLYEQQGRSRRAVSLYERVLRLEPGHEQAAAALAGLKGQ